MGNRFAGKGRTARGGLLMGLVCAGALAATPVASAAPPPVRFAYTGAEQSYVVPADVFSLQVAATGAPGGIGVASGTGGTGGAGADGSQVNAVVPVTPGETLYVEVGGAGGAGTNTGGNGGFNGGGSGMLGGGGGGGSDIRTASCATTCPGSTASLQSRLVVAAGGGGGAGAFDVLNGGAGGAGGLVGANGTNGQGGSPCTGGSGGAGGTATAGGTGGAAASGIPGICIGFSSGSAGLLGSGGASGLGVDAGGGGGGGYWGGGGGGAGSTSGGGGGGGGSSFGPTAATFAQDATGAPAVTLNPLSPPAVQVTPATLSFPTQPMGTVSAPQTVTVKNTGQGALNVTGLSFTGADPGDFFVGSSTCGGSVAGGAGCQVTVFFVAQGQGARTATLDVTSNDPGSPATVSLSGTGGALPAGPAGPGGPAGATGAKGATGPQGPAGTVVCRRDTVALALCSIIFPRGTFTVASAKSARYAISLGGRDVATGRATIHHGVVTLLRLRALRRGRYQIVLTVGSGRHRRTLLKRTIRIR